MLSARPYKRKKLSALWCRVLCLCAFVRKRNRSAVPFDDSNSITLCVDIGKYFCKQKTNRIHCSIAMTFGNVDLFDPKAKPIVISYNCARLKFPYIS